MRADRRLLGVTFVAVLVAAPAVALQAMCVGRSCQRTRSPAAEAPFCSLPATTRAAVAAGYRDGRSPDLLAVTADEPGVTGPADVAPGVPWPSTAPGAGQVPLVFAGDAVRRGAEVRDGTTLDSVAPTLAAALGLRRPHPEVRSGTEIPGLVSGKRARLGLIVVWRGISSAVLERHPDRWPALRGLLGDGPGTLRSEVGSLPLDPPAVLTTIGTGGLPRQHGITGTLVRDDEGAVVEAWAEGAPFSVIAALGDDLDERSGQAARIGLVGGDPSERGLIGRNWYLRHDRDDVRIEAGSTAAERAAAARRLLASRFGTDRSPDLLAVVLDDTVGAMDRATAELVAAVRAAADGTFVAAVTATGGAGRDGIPAEELITTVRDRTEVPADGIVAATPGGLFLDPEALAEVDVPDDRIAAALEGVTVDGRRPIVDAFPGFAVSLARYC
jgi:hypothetical protein